jgi:hypothetical protein
MSEWSIVACNTHSFLSSASQTAERVHRPRGLESNMAATCSRENVPPVSNEMSVPTVPMYLKQTNRIRVRILKDHQVII